MTISRSRYASPSVALQPSRSTRAARIRRPTNMAIPSKGIISHPTSLPSGPLLAAREAGIRLSNQPEGFEAGPGDRDAPPPPGHNRSRHHEGDRMAAPLGPRLLYLGGAQQARPDARVREEWWRPGLPHCGREYRAEAQDRAARRRDAHGSPIVRSRGDQDRDR